MHHVWTDRHTHGKGLDMQQVEIGQCGLCSHFGENTQDPQIFQIRLKHEAFEAANEVQAD